VKVLLVAATPLEARPWVARLMALMPAHPSPWLQQVYYGRIEKHEVMLLLTGLGQTNTAFALGAFLASQPPPDYLINLGICGSYNPQHPPGTVVQVVEEVYGDLGAEEGEAWLGLQELGFPAFVHQGQPVYNRLIHLNPAPLVYPQVRGLTLNQVSGNPATIERMRQRWQPDIETMEGAAVFQAAIQYGVPFVCLRAVSNWVAPRSQHPWQPAAALAALHLAVAEHLGQL
jgi:futalosine hydrolase